MRVIDADVIINWYKYLYMCNLRVNNYKIHFDKDAIAWPRFYFYDLLSGLD